MRITSGKYKNRPIESGISSGPNPYRPTTARTRMAVFNLLQHSPFVSENILKDSIIADICCGSGAMGLEALSHGAQTVYFIDKNPAHIKHAKLNVASLKEEAHSVFLTLDAAQLKPLPVEFNIIFLDPPYSPHITNEILASIQRNLRFAPNHIIVVENSLKEDINVSGFMALDTRQYGRTQITLGQFAG